MAEICWFCILLYYKNEYLPFSKIEPSPKYRTNKIALHSLIKKEIKPMPLICHSVVISILTFKLYLCSFFYYIIRLKLSILIFCFQLSDNLFKMVIINKLLIFPFIFFIQIASKMPYFIALLLYDFFYWIVFQHIEVLLHLCQVLLLLQSLQSHFSFNKFLLSHN